MTLHLRDLVVGLRSLRLEKAPLVVHASLSAFGQVDGGAGTVVKALLAVSPSILVPTFTYKTMLIPESGPAGNGLTYGSGRDHNRMAEFFRPNMPADPLMGLIPETLRLHPAAKRSTHPILSFAGINAEKFLAAQSHAGPLRPLTALAQADGWVLLIGVTHTVNTSIHAAEKLAGRRTFIRWALTPRGVIACPSFPGCSAGFDQLAPDLERYTRQVQIGAARLQAVPLKMLFHVVTTHLKQDPLALLCSSPECGRCQSFMVNEKEDN